MLLLNWLWSEGNGEKLSKQVEHLERLVKEIKQVCGLADESKDDESKANASDAEEKKDEGKTKRVRQQNRGRRA